MTEFWKSNANYWCDICKVWMTDNVSTRATHEKGIAHKDNVAKSELLFFGTPTSHASANQIHSCALPHDML